MGIGLRGENLIFVISQPRAGSTLLQRILASHPDIHTASETWLMLRPLYALRPEWYEAEYNARWARSAVEHFLQTLPGGDDEYIEGLRRMYTYLYECSLAGSGKRYFLDKTPRYYFVLPELYRVFPQANYIILLRNPLAVLCSILNTWIKENRFSLYRYKHDLIRAPRLLLEGMDILDEQAVVVHYEQLVDDAESEIQRICERLGVDSVPGMIEYGHHNLPRWHFGDPEGVYQHSRPVAHNADKWILALDDPQVWRLANDYLRFLSQQTVEQMGYAYEELQRVLEAHRPKRIRLWRTFPLDWLLKEPKGRERWMHNIARLTRSFRRRGVRGTMVAAARRGVYVLSNPE